MLPLSVQIKMLGHLPVKHFLPLVRVNVGTAFSAVPARKITRLKINTCNTTVLPWLQLARNAFLVYLPSLPLARVWVWIDLIKHKPGWELAEGAGVGVERRRSGWVCPALRRFVQLFSLVLPHWELSGLNPAPHQAPVLHLHGNDKEVETQGGRITAASGSWSWWFLLTYLCPPISSCIGELFFPSWPWKKRGELRKAVIFPAKYRTFWFSAGDCHGFDAKFSLRA